MIANNGRRLSKRNRDAERGLVLILVLWISLGLASTALLFGHSMMLEYRAADNTIAAAQAGQAIEGARRYIQLILSELEEKGTVPEAESYESEQVFIGDAVFWLLGRGDEYDSSDTQVYALVDEASKLNLNTASAEMLEALPGMTQELAAAIVDWRDTDSEVSPSGAESEAYLLRTPKYECKNSPFETVEELRLVVGADWGILYGEDLNGNGILDPNEDDGNESAPEDNRNGRLDPGILEYLTVYSREPNQTSDGSDRININDDEEDGLNTLLEETFSQERANEIQSQIGSGETEFTSILEFQIRSGMTLEEFAEIADNLTVSDEDSQEGLINVNTASEAVLACIPGIGEEYAARLVSYRRGKTDELDCVAWVTEVLDDENAIEAGPYLTVKSYQFSADVVAVGRNGKGFQRTLFVFDTTGDEPIVVYRRDRSYLGWALGTEVRSRLATSAKEQQW